MKAFVIHRIQPVVPDAPPLRLVNRAEPVCGPDDVRIAVSVCGVCHTELDEIEGRTPPNELPRVPGHQIVGIVVERGSNVTSPALGARVGVAWIHRACGRCAQCAEGRENLCASFEATGRDVDGGYAEFTVAPAAFVHPIPDSIADEHAAPLLCAGAVGYRSLTQTGLRDGQTLGLTGFGASNHLVLLMALRLYPRSPVVVFARSPEERALATERGASWTGDTSDRPPAALDAIIDTTPAWRPIVSALDRLAPGGRLVINAIRKEPDDLTAWQDLDYASHLWMEKSIVSVANVTRHDVRACLALAADAGITPTVQRYPFDDANDALIDLKMRRIRGAKVLDLRHNVR